MALRISYRNVIDESSCNFEPDTLEEAKAIIEHLQATIRNKDRRFVALTKSEEALRAEIILLYERIEQLKDLLDKVGIKVA